MLCQLFQIQMVILNTIGYYNVWSQEIRIGERPLQFQGEVPPAEEDGEQIVSSASSEIQCHENVRARRLLKQRSRGGG